LSRDVDGHVECHELDSPDVRRWLTRTYFESIGRLPSSGALSGSPHEACSPTIKRSSGHPKSAARRD
jgi:hypothetical protein